MNPRLKTSVKWTALPPELCEQIRAVFKETFAENTGKGDIFVEGRIYPTELMLRVGFLEKGRLRQANFEVSLDINPQKQNALELIHFAVDCAGSMMSDYFERDEDLEEFPREWEAHTIEGKKAYLQVTTHNTSLESEADRILGRLEESLVQGDADIDEEDAVITMLGLDQGGDFPEDEVLTEAEAEAEAEANEITEENDNKTKKKTAVNKRSPVKKSGKKSLH